MYLTHCSCAFYVHELFYPQKHRPAKITILAEYDRESILEKTRAGQLLAVAKGKHIGRPKGLDAEKFAKVKKAVERGLSVAETVSLTGISMSSVKRYRKQIERASTIG